MVTKNPFKCREKASGCFQDSHLWTGNIQMQRCCENPQCVLKRTVKIREKAEAKKAKDGRATTRKQKEALKTRGQWIKESQIEFNKFIRLRDKDLPCISCGRHHQGQYHAGHLLTTAARPDLRFCEIQVRKQCAPCNNHLSGNVLEYRKALIKIIGAKAVHDLESGLRGRSDWSISDLKEIKLHYRARAKELNGE